MCSFWKFCTFGSAKCPEVCPIERQPQRGEIFVDGKYLFEIGGKQNLSSQQSVGTHAQIAGVDNSYVVRDDVEFPVGKSVPLWLMGCLY
jgi:ABC-type transporter Mla maintaining outer membrane lipid asymmetry ATPase subunit MlaF